MPFLLTIEEPEGPDNDTEFVGVFETDDAARAFAEAAEVAYAMERGFELEPLAWDWNPCYDSTDPGFGSSGGSGQGWRVREVPAL
jgi:hypothetical protein